MFQRHPLTIKDLNNICLWYQRTKSSHSDLTDLDERTMIKIKAMMIYLEEELDEFSELTGGRK